VSRDVNIHRYRTYEPRRSLTSSIDRTMLFLQHIPRTAGTSLKSFIDIHYPVPDVCRVKWSSDLRWLTGRQRCYVGHFWWDDLERLAKGLATATVLRDPVARCWSLYRFLRRFPTPPTPHHAQINRTLRRAMDADGDWVRLQTASSAAAVQIQRQPWQHPAIPPPQERLQKHLPLGCLRPYSDPHPRAGYLGQDASLPAHKFFLSDYPDFTDFFVNGMAKMFVPCSAWQDGIEDERLHDLALANLEQMSLVGIHEDLDGFVRRLAGLLGWVTPHEVPWVNRASGLDIPAAIANLIAERNQVDARLHAWARQHWASAVEPPRALVQPTPVGDRHTVADGLNASGLYRRDTDDGRTWYAFTGPGPWVDFLVEARDSYSQVYAEVIPTYFLPLDPTRLLACTWFVGDRPIPTRTFWGPGPVCRIEGKLPTSLFGPMRLRLHAPLRSQMQMEDRRPANTRIAGIPLTAIGFLRTPLR
jgi:hypothetical protein